MEILKIAILIAALGNFLLGIFVYLKDPSKKINRLFGISGIITAIWVFSNFMMGIQQSLFWLKSTSALGSLVPPIAMLWVLELCDKNIKKWGFSLLFVVTIFFFIASYINNLIIANVESVYLGGFEGEKGPLFIFYWIYIFGILAFILYTLISSYYKTEGIKKIQISYVLIGTILYISTVLMVSFILPLFGDFELTALDSPASFFLIIFTALAITRYHLFEVRILLTELLVGVVGVILLIDLLSSRGLSTIALKTGIFIAFGYLGYLLIKSVIIEIQRRQEIEKIDRAKSEFISIASHQLRTPLTAVKGYISMVLEGTYGQIAEKLSKPLENVYQSNERLIRLVNDLLNLSRLDAGKIEFSPEPTSLEEMVSGIIEELRINAEKKGLYMKMIKPSEPLPKIMVDQDKLRQVILNIIDNAIKYTKEGGITLELKKLDGEEEIKVSDTGEGMDEKELDSLFQMFSRATAGTQLYTEGAGLGLYVARQFVEMHGGEIWAESPGKGKGSTFIIQLPIRLDPKSLKEKTKTITKAANNIF